MDEAVAYAPVKYRCEVHGTHTAVVNVQAVAEDRREVRRYCMFCLIEHFDGLGLAQVTLEIARAALEQSEPKP